jgi:hypothetical protein
MGPQAAPNPAVFALKLESIRTSGRALVAQAHAADPR